MKEKHLWLLCGAPGSGKSTWVKNEIKNHGGNYVSRDEVRFSMLKDNEDYFAHENEVFNNFVKYIQNSLDILGGDVYADASHLNWPSRRKLLTKLHLSDVKVGVIVFDTSLETCLERNALRNGRALVPRKTVISMYRSRQNPKKDNFKYFCIKHIDENGNEKEMM